MRIPSEYDLSYQVSSVKVAGKEIHVRGHNAQKVVESPKFKNWLETIDTNRFEIRDIDIRWADFSHVDLLFAYLDCQVLDKVRNTIAPRSLVFLRGNSVAIFVILVDEDQKRYLLLVQQPRFPAGTMLTEIPAGIIDGNGDPIGTAFKEIQEETGIAIKSKNIVPLLGSPLFTSPGGCDEQIHFFYCGINKNRKEIEELQGKLTGLREENERIQLLIVPFDEVTPCTFNDMKSGFAFLRYKFMTANWPEYN